MLENSEKKIIENCVNLEERLENKLSETKQQLDQKIREIESQFALLSSKTDLSPPGAADENVGEVNSSPNKDVKIKEGKESPACSVAGDKEQHSIRHTTCETKMRMKPPQFDGKTPWPNYLLGISTKVKPTPWRLRTATGQPATIHGELDFKRGVLQINEEEVVLHGRTEERVRVVLAEDSSISERCEAILYACPDGRYNEGSIMMVEPGTHDSE
ncbi:hypothetical protein NQ317_015587, partial [Molorchus minor]